MAQSHRQNREPAGDFRLVPPGALAEQADVHHTTVRRIVKRGDLPVPIRVGNRLLFDLADLELRLQAQKLKAAASCTLSLGRE